MSFTLLTHNAYWLQGMPFEGTDPGAPRAEVLAGLAALYHSLNADALCVQELQSPEASAALSAELKLQSEYRSGKLFPQYGGAILFKAGAAAGDALVAGASVERFWLKVRLGAGAPAGAVLCNVHLPSGRQSSPEEAVRARVSELRGMLAAAPRPNLVAGDFNEPPGGGVQALMEAEGFVDLAARFGHGETDSHTRKHARRIDYIWASAAWAARAKSFHIPAPAELALGGARFLSDHLPLAVCFE
jgi:endonuclease/exonuclease/phosphatase (EEP) superfamily protein YafD